MIARAVAALGLLASLPGVVPAQEARLDPVEVRADRQNALDPDSIANPYRVSPSSRASVQTLNADEIAAYAPRDVFDLLNHAVGVLPLYQGRKVPMHLQIRGEGNFAYIIDGAYIERDTGARILAALPLDAIERVEIVRDATALTLGPLVNFASAGGAPNDGFVVIRTRKPGRTGGHLKAQLESEGTTALEGGASWRGEQGAYAGAVLRGFETDGQTGAHAARDNLTALALGGVAQDRYTLDLTAFRDHGSFEFQRANAQAGAVMAGQKWAFDPIGTTLFALNARVAWDDRQTTLFSVYRNELKATFEQGSFTSNAVVLHANEETSTGAALKHGLRLGDTLVQAGLQYHHWETPTGQLFYEYAPRDEEIASGFLLAEHQLLDGALVLDGAYRADQKNILKGVDSYGHASAYNASTFTDRRLPIAHFVALGASWTPRPDWAYTARYAYGAQSANLAVYTDVGTVLHDEVQNKAEVSARYSGLGDWIEPQLTLFYAHDENYKYPVRFDTGTQQAIFTEATAHKTGLEISAHGHLGEDTRWHLGWTHMFYNPIVDDHGRTAPRNQAVLSLTHAWKVWEFQGALQYVDAFSSNFPTGGAYKPIGDFVRLDLSASHRVALGGRPITLRFYGRNVGDAHYSTQVGFTDPGTVWGASAQLDF